MTDFAELSGGVAMAISDGRVLTAEHAVFCTGYEFLGQMQTRSHRVTSTWAIATGKIANMPRWLRDTIVWEASEPYLYFWAEPSGRLIAGGEDEETSEGYADRTLLDDKARIIVERLGALTGLAIPGAPFRWAAPFSVTDDGLPIIDRVGGHDRVYAVMGFGGNGITFSMIAAQIVAAAIAGTDDPGARLFRLR